MNRSSLPLMLPALALCLWPSSRALGANDSSITELIAAVRERHDAIEDVYAAAFKLMNDYHTEVKAATGAVVFSHPMEPGQTMNQELAYTDEVADRFKPPVYSFELTAEDYTVPAPHDHYTYKNSTEQTSANQSRAYAIQQAQNALNTENAKTYTHGSYYMEPGTAVAYDYEGYQKAYWEWFVDTRKAAIEDATPPQKFGQDWWDFTHTPPEHPGLTAANAKDLDVWTTRHVREVARKQRRLDAANNSSVVPWSQAIVDADDQALSTWSTNRTAWLAAQEKAASIAHLDAVKDFYDGLEVEVNEDVVRKAAEKWTYFGGLNDGFKPCGTNFVKAELKLKYENPSTLEQQIIVLNQLSQHVARLACSYVSLGDLSKFTGDSGLESIGFSGQRWNSCGLVTSKNYRERIAAMRQMLRTMDALPYPMLGKQYSLDRWLTGDKLGSSTNLLKLGENQHDVGSTIWASATESIYLAPWNPYGDPIVFYSNSWQLSPATSAVEKTYDANDDPEDWRCSYGTAYSCYTNATNPSSLILESRFPGNRHYKIPVGNANPPIDGKVRIFEFNSQSTGFVGDDDVKFKRVVVKVGDTVSTVTTGKTAVQIRAMAYDYAAWHKWRLERSYKNSDSFKKMGLPEKLEIPVEIGVYPVEEGEEENENLFEMKCDFAPADYLPAGQVTPESFDHFTAKGDALLFRKPALTRVTDAPLDYSPTQTPQAFVSGGVSGEDYLCAVKLPLTVRSPGPTSPRLSVALFRSYYGMVLPAYSGISNIGFSRNITIENGFEPLTVKCVSSELGILSYQTAGQGGFETVPLDPAAAGQDLSRVSSVEFDGGKLEITWSSPTNITCKYYLKSGSGYSATACRTYEIAVGGTSGQLYERQYQVQYPAGVDTVTIKQDGKTWAKAVMEYTQYDPNISDSCRVDYIDVASNGTESVSATTRRFPSGSSESAVAGAPMVSSSVSNGYTFGGNPSLGPIGGTYPYSFGDRHLSVVTRETIYPELTPNEDTDFFSFYGDFPYVSLWSSAFDIGNSRGGLANYGTLHFHQRAHGSSDRAAMLWDFPQEITLVGEDWGRDDETTEYDVTGDFTLRSYTLAGMDAETSQAISNNTVTVTSKLDGKEMASATEVYSAGMSNVARSQAGMNTSVEFYTDGEIPWATKKITTPAFTREYTYTKVGTSGLKILETTTGTGGGVVTTTETETNDGGGFKSMTQKLNGVTVGSATSSGHSLATTWQPTSVTILSGGVTRTHALEYHPDGSLKKHNNGNGKIDSFEWDVIGRIKSGSKVDSMNLNPTYTGLTTKFQLAGETLQYGNSQYGELESLSDTMRAGLTVNKASGGPGDGSRTYSSDVTSEARGVANDYTPDGLPKKLGGGLGSPGVRYTYTTETIGGVNCLAVSSRMLKGDGTDTSLVSTDYFDGYGRIVRSRRPNPAGSGFADTNYSYDVANRRVTVTPPSPSKPIVMEHDSTWRNKTVSSAGHNYHFETTFTGATVKNTVKDGTREVYSTQVAGNSGQTISKINGKNAVTSTPSSSGSSVSVSGPWGSSLNLTYGKHGVTSLSGMHQGNSFSAHYNYSTLGDVNYAFARLPGAGNWNHAWFDKAGRTTSTSASGSNKSISRTYPNDGVKVTTTGTPARDNFSFEEDSNGHLRARSRSGRDSLVITGDVRTGSVTYALAGGIAGQQVTDTYNGSMYLSGRTRNDGSGHSFGYHSNGQMSTMTKFDGASLGGGNYTFSLTNDPVTGYSTGFTSSQSSLAMVPNPDGTTSGVTYNSTDIDSQAQTYSCQYPAYFDGEPVEEVFGGILSGFKVERTYNPTTGLVSDVKLRQGGTLVHSVNYTPNAFGMLGSVTTSQSASFTAQYQRPSAYVRTLTSGSVVTTRNLASDGSARLTGVTTQAGGGTYAANFVYQGMNRSGLTVSGPDRPSATWSYTFQDQANYAGQLQSATRSGGTSPLVLNYNHNNLGVRSGTTLIAANQYTVTRTSGARTITVSGQAAPGATVEITSQGAILGNVTAAGDGSFSKTIPVPAGAGTGTIPLSVVGTLIGGGDNGTNAKFRQNSTVALTPTSWTTVYGAHGALASDWRWTYRWDSEGRLAGMESIAGTTPNLKIKFAYDDRGRRIRKSVAYLPPGGGTPTRTVVTKFIYDDWRLLAEHIDDSTQTPYLRSYTWGADAFDQVGGKSMVGALVAIHSQGQTYMPVFDASGNVIALVSSSGARVASWEYGPFGELLASSGKTQLCPFGFATQYTDAESGLAYFGHRYYSPVTGRWLSREPLGELESFNLYSYCHNDPVNKVDLLGLAEAEVNGHINNAKATLAALYLSLEALNGKTDDELLASVDSIEGLYASYLKSITGGQDELRKFQDEGWFMSFRGVDDDLSGQLAGMPTSIAGMRPSAAVNSQLQRGWSMMSAAAGRQSGILDATHTGLVVTETAGNGIALATGVGGLGVATGKIITTQGMKAGAIFLAKQGAIAGGTLAAGYGLEQGMVVAGVPAERAQMVMKGAELFVALRALKLARIANASSSAGRMDSPVEANAARRLGEMEAANPNAHFVGRHGAGTTIEAQHIRATTGLTPDGFAGRPVDSSRFFSNQMQLNAAQRAQTIFRQTGRSSFSFDMGTMVGEGFTRGGGELIRTTNVQAVFRNGQLYTMFPKLGPIP